METFVEVLEKLAEDIYETKEQYKVFRGSNPLVDGSLCWLCDCRMSEIDKVLDHLQIIGRFLGSARSKCNSKTRKGNYVPIFAQNISNCHHHHFYKNLTFFSDDSKVQVISADDEKIFSLSLLFRVSSYADSRSVEKNVYDYFRFINSYWFMASSLDNFVIFLPKGSVNILHHFFSGYIESARVF